MQTIPFLFLILIVQPTNVGLAAEGAPAKQSGLNAVTATKAQRAIDRGIAFLLPQQTPEGAWKGFDKPHPAITALVAKCIMQDEHHGPKHAAVRRAIAYLERFIQPDGGIYVEGEGMRNYHTSVALMALAATQDPKHAATIRKAQAFLKNLQWDDGEGHEASSAWYGGAGYGRHKRPDLSNTQLMLEALTQSGLSQDDPVYKKAMVFVTRCQMLGEKNDQTFAESSNDGGFVYTAANGGESKAGTTMDGDRPRLRSYGSMTYSGFKSMLYARLDRDDVRVRSAMEWIKKHYTLDSNPNMPETVSRQGLYYYYHVFARAMQAWGREEIVDASGRAHPWREELCSKLISLQRPDGAWVNDEDRWFEGNPHLVTAYAILALQTALAE